MKKGDIILMPFPFTDLTGQKNRPAVVLAINDMDVTVSFITSQTKWQEKYDIILEPSLENGLKKPSIMRINKLATISKELVIGKLGAIAHTEVQQLNKNLIKLFELNS